MCKSSYIEVKSMCGSQVGYVRPNTIGYLKCKNGEIRMCKCVSVIWMADEKHQYSARLEPIYTWNVAGIGRVHTNREYYFECDLGIIYENESYAQHGASNRNSYSEGRIRNNAEFSVFSAIARYGIPHNKVYFEYMGAFNKCLEIRGVKIDKEGCISYHCVYFYFRSDSNGNIVANIPDFDEGLAYPSEEKAKSAWEPKRVITFDDVENLESCKKSAEQKRIEELETIIRNAQAELAKINK